jgi:hypothetical protein
MGYALWFYGEDEFHVFQCVYPDLNNRFPGDHGFDTTWRDRPALLFQDAIPSAVQRDFWAANDPSSSRFDWTFRDSAHMGVYTTKRIMNGDEPILYVFHDAEDGARGFTGQANRGRKMHRKFAFTRSSTKIRLAAGGGPRTREDVL